MSRTQLRASGLSDTAIRERIANGRLRIEIHRSRFLDPSDVAYYRGVPVTAVPRTLVDLAGVVSEVALGRVLAQAEVLRLYDAAALHDVLSRSKGRRAGPDAHPDAQ